MPSATRAYAAPIVSRGDASPGIVSRHDERATTRFAPTNGGPRWAYDRRRHVLAQVRVVDGYRPGAVRGKWQSDRLACCSTQNDQSSRCTFPICRFGRGRMHRSASAGPSRTNRPYAGIGSHLAHGLRHRRKRGRGHSNQMAERPGMWSSASVSRSPWQGSVHGCVARLVRNAGDLQAHLGHWRTTCSTASVG